MARKILRNTCLLHHSQGESPLHPQSYQKMRTVPVPWLKIKVKYSLEEGLE
jgi:hypothetical protein